MASHCSLSYLLRAPGFPHALLFLYFVYCATSDAAQHVVKRDIVGGVLSEFAVCARLNVLQEAVSRSPRQSKVMRLTSSKFSNFLRHASQYPGFMPSARLA